MPVGTSPKRPSSAKAANARRDVAKRDKGKPKGGSSGDKKARVAERDDSGPSSGGEDDVFATMESTGNAEKDIGLKDDVHGMLAQLGLGGKKDADWKVKRDSAKAMSTANDRNAKEAKVPKKSDKPKERKGKTSAAVPAEFEEDASESESEASPAANMKSTLLLKPNSLWHAIALPDLPVDLSTPSLPSPASIAKAKARAETLLESEVVTHEAFSTRSTSRADRSFLATMMKSGTLTDKISALTLRVQESPLHNLRAFEALVAMAKKANRREAGLALAALKDMMLGSVLPDRKLRFFQDQPLGHSHVTDKHLIVWMFEDRLKRDFFDLVQVMEALSHDTLQHLRLNVTGYIYELLTARPEQEQNLLRLLVNKLGDADKKVSSRASHLLLQLVQTHPAMKRIVVSALEEHIFRGGMQPRAQYYAVITLNQIILTTKEVDVANKLIDIYFTYFRKLLATPIVAESKELAKLKKKKGLSKEKREEKIERHKEIEQEVADQLRGRIIAALLTGVNRAFPFAKVPDDHYEQHMDTLFKIAHTGAFNVVIQALRLIYQVCSAKASVTDRFYRVLYDALADPRLVVTSKQSMFLNLLYQALKSDSSTARQQAFLKRAMQVACYHQPPFVCGLLFVSSELMELKPGLKSFVLQPMEDDDDEHFVDAPDPDSAFTSDLTMVKAVSDRTAPSETYDGKKRDPKFANADRSCLWELVLLTQHYHPAVVMHAKHVVACSRVPRAPQLQMHTLAHFLDKFSYRNPKKQDSEAAVTGLTRGNSIMQPTGDASIVPGARTIVSWQRGGGSGSSALNSASFLKQAVETINAEDVFFHQYYRGKKDKEEAVEKRKRKKRRVGDSDDESGSDVDLVGGSDASGHSEVEEDSEAESVNEDEVWKAMQSSMKGFKDMQLPSDGDDGDGDTDSGDDDDVFRAAMNEDISDSDSDAGSDAGSDANSGNASQDGEGIFGGDFGDEGDSESNSSSAAEPAAAVKNLKRKRKALPMFASFDDYAEMLDRDE